MSENNRAQRRALARKSTRRAATIGTALTGLVGSGFAASPAYASTESVTTCTAAALDTAMTAAGSGGTVNVNTTGNCVITLDSTIHGWAPGGDFTVNGPTSAGSSLTIHAYQNYQVFSAWGLSLTNMTLVGNATTNASLVYVGNDSTFDHVTFRDNHDSNSGGAIYANGGSLTITDSNFSGNTGYAGGAVWAEGNVTVTDSDFSDNSAGAGGGGAIINNGATSIDGSTFSNNHTDAAGGALLINISLTVQDSTFTNNDAVDGGGAAQISGVVDISSSKFTSNSVAQPSGSADGGALKLTGASGSFGISTSEFVNNTADGEGGAIITHPFAEGGIISKSTFYGNSGSYGGALSLYSGGMLVNSTLVGNEASVQGGAVYAEGGQTMSNLTVWNNSAPSDSAALVAEGTLFGSIVANDPGVAGVSVKTGAAVDYPTDLGANLVTASDWDLESSPTWVGADSGTAEVTSAQLNLRPLKLYTKTPTNTGVTRTVALGPNSIARDYYTLTTPPPNPIRPAVAVADPGAPTVDQRGVDRPQGSAIDVGAYEGGVPVTQVGILRFRGFSAVLHNDDKAKLRRIARELKASGATTVTLQGHTATITKSKKSLLAYRLDLSRRRSRAVKLYLKAQLKARHYDVTFKSTAYGSTRPVGSNSKNAGRAANRRVVIWAE